MKIDQISLLSGRAQGLIARMLLIAPILQFMEFKLDASTSMHLKDSDSFSGSSARAENGAIQKDNQVPSAELVNLALYGREVAIDDVRKLDSNVGLSPVALKLFSDRRLAGLAVKLAEEIQNHIFIGTAAANEMLGLLNFVKDAAAAGQTARLGFTTAELASMNTQVASQINTTATQDAFIELLEKELATVPGANAIICNANLGARLSTIARRLGAAGETKNSFGQPVKTFNDVPIVKMPVSAMGNTESDGVNNDCTSLLVVRFAEELGVACKTNSGFYFQDFENVEATPQGKARMQMFLNLAVERKDSLKRLSRIRL